MSKPLLCFKRAHGLFLAFFFSLCVLLASIMLMCQDLSQEAHSSKVKVCNDYIRVQTTLSVADGSGETMRNICFVSFKYMYSESCFSYKLPNDEAVACFAHFFESIVNVIIEKVKLALDYLRSIIQTFCLS